jgi:hypothetical protein
VLCDEIFCSLYLRPGEPIAKQEPLVRDNSPGGCRDDQAWARHWGAAEAVKVDKAISEAGKGMKIKVVSPKNAAALAKHTYSSNWPGPRNHINHRTLETDIMMYLIMRPGLQGATGALCLPGTGQP